MEKARKEEPGSPRARLSLVPRRSKAEPRQSCLLFPPGAQARIGGSANEARLRSAVPPRLSYHLIIHACMLRWICDVVDICDSDTGKRGDRLSWRERCSTPSGLYLAGNPLSRGFTPGFAIGPFQGPQLWTFAPGPRRGPGPFQGPRLWTFAPGPRRGPTAEPGVKPQENGITPDFNPEGVEQSIGQTRLTSIPSRDQPIPSV